eukprot:CAMPEP_0194258612 /NCGR_PEP_ID=MMETSP0158-20130606/41661_1 /TAXON_ID=33649 /ORGANISM="Thalassionema nitzschioides, Strain L26-B" /LENGTH=103 /DNA_ID=CAMNT_0038998085 /DNA_START=38 /DNA_END=346 /DNA_ORIENTATION=-
MAPCSSRRRATLEIVGEISIAISGCDEPIATGIRMVSTGRRERLKNNATFSTLDLAFWAKKHSFKKNDNALENIYSTNVILPKNWNARMYLGALELSFDPEKI